MTQYTAFEPKQLCNFKVYFQSGDDHNMFSQGLGN